MCQLGEEQLLIIPKKVFLMFWKEIFEKSRAEIRWQKIDTYNVCILKSKKGRTIRTLLKLKTNNNLIQKNLGINAGIMLNVEYWMYTICFYKSKNIGILLPKLFWPTVRRNSDWENLLKFEAAGREFAKILRSLEQFLWTVIGQNKFW